MTGDRHGVSGLLPICPIILAQVTETAVREPAWDDARPHAEAEGDGSDYGAATVPTLPSSIALERGLFPVVHLSSSSMYPNAQDFHWRSSCLRGEPLFVVETDEWVHAHGPCYFRYVEETIISLC
jgi:hypothetical protein